MTDFRAVPANGVSAGSCLRASPSSFDGNAEKQRKLGILRALLAQVIRTFSSRDGSAMPGTGQSAELAARWRDHHLFSNNGTLWLHATVQLEGPEKKAHRFRASLETKDIAAARVRRDEFLSCLRERRDVVLSIRMIRGSPPRTRTRWSNSSTTKGGASTGTTSSARS